MFTTENAPKGYSGPVRLTPAQRVRTAELHDAWTQTLIAQARDASDPETQANAQSLLRTRGISY